MLQGGHRWSFSWCARAPTQDVCGSTLPFFNPTSPSKKADHLRAARYWQQGKEENEILSCTQSERLFPWHGRLRGSWSRDGAQGFGTCLTQHLAPSQVLGHEHVGTNEGTVGTSTTCISLEKLQGVWHVRLPPANLRSQGTTCGCRSIHCSGQARRTRRAICWAVSFKGKMIQPAGTLPYQ